MQEYPFTGGSMKTKKEYITSMLDKKTNKIWLTFPKKIEAEEAHPVLQELCRNYLAATRLGCHEISWDMAQLQTLDPIGIGVLIMILRSAENEGIHTEAQSPQPEIQKILKKTGLVKLVSRDFSDLTKLTK